MYSMIIIAGELVEKPTLTTEDGKNVCTFTVVDLQNRKNRDGERFTFKRQYQIEAMGQEAMSCYKHLTIGSQVIAEGRPGLKTWIDSSGSARGVVRVITDHVRFIGREEREADLYEEGVTEWPSR